MPSQATRNGLLSFSDPSQFPSNCAPTAVTNQCQVASGSADRKVPLRAVYSRCLPTPCNRAATSESSGSPRRKSRPKIISRPVSTTNSRITTASTQPTSGTIPRPWQPGTFGELYSDLVSNRQAATIHEQHIFSPNLLNVAQIGATRAVGIQGKVDHIASPYQSVMTDHQYAFEPGGFAGDIQSIPGVTSFLGAPTAEGYIPSSRALYWTTYQGGDYVALIHGIHSIKFGGQFERMQDNEVSASNINGLFRFDSLAQFLTNRAVPLFRDGNSAAARYRNAPDAVWGIRRRRHQAAEDADGECRAALRNGDRADRIARPHLRAAQFGFSESAGARRAADLRQKRAGLRRHWALFSKTPLCGILSRASDLPGTRIRARHCFEAALGFLMYSRCRMNSRSPFSGPRRSREPLSA